MEVLLLQDVNGIGKKNDVLIVGDGFALNHLLPQRKALVATPTVRKRYADQIKKRAEEKERERKMQSELASLVAGKTVHFKRKVTKTGKLYAAISEKDIAKALQEQLQVDVPANAVEIPEPIKSVGVSTAQLKLGSQVHPLHVDVEAEK